MGGHTPGHWENPGACGEPRGMLLTCRARHELGRARQHHVIAKKVHKVQNRGGGG
jgi:hypothetical protein